MLKILRGGKRVFKNSANVADKVTFKLNFYGNKRTKVCWNLVDCFAPLRYARNDSFVLEKEVGILFFECPLIKGF